MRFETGDKVWYYNTLRSRVVTARVLKDYTCDSVHAPKELLWNLFVEFRDGSRAYINSTRTFFERANAIAHRNAAREMERIKSWDEAGKITERILADQSA